MLLYLFSLLLLCTVTAAGHHQSYETIYVHTDRCNFCAGDTVWFQVYVMDTRQQAESYSHFVYAELLHDTIRMATEKSKSAKKDSPASSHYPTALPRATTRCASTPYVRHPYPFPGSTTPLSPSVPTAACSPALPQTKHRCLPRLLFPRRRTLADRHFDTYCIQGIASRRTGSEHHRIYHRLYRRHYRSLPVGTSGYGKLCL